MSILVAFTSLYSMIKSRRPIKPGSLYVGLMSGTSVDGIDTVVTRLTGAGRGLRAELLAHVHTEFPPRFRTRVLNACLHGSVAEICELNFVLGEQFARAALSAILLAKLKPSQITAIGSHGQTVHHLPNAKPPSTLQIGEPSVIAERTGITTVADFRVRDMAAGGQGAPLVPYADWALFTHSKHPRIIQNIGGIGNLTFLPPSASLEDVIAFDTGPGNMVMDAVITKLTRGRETFDRGGQLAARGMVADVLLDECLTHPYLRRGLPKTTGREEFGEMFVKKFLSRAKQLRLTRADTMATATMFTAASIWRAYRRFVFPKVKREDLKHVQTILGGGGAKNATLVRMLKQQMAGAFNLRTNEDFGIPSSAKEPLAFAILAHATINGIPSNVPAVTGARRAVVLGKIVTAC